MAYREEKDGMEARIEGLEEELDEAKQTIARLQGEGGAAPPDADVDWITGATTQFHLERELPFEVSDAGYEAIAELLGQRIVGATVAQVGRTLTLRRHTTTELRLTRDDSGRTKLKLSADYRQGRGAVLLGSPGIALLAGVMGGGALGVTGNNWAMLVGGIVAASAGLFGFRQLLRRGVEKDQALLRGTFEAVCDLAAKHEKARGKRIEATADESAAEQETAEEDALAAEDAEAERGA